MICWLLCKQKLAVSRWMTLHCFLVELLSASSDPKPQPEFFLSEAIKRVSGQELPRPLFCKRVITWHIGTLCLTLNKPAAILVNGYLGEMSMAANCALPLLY